MAKFIGRQQEVGVSRESSRGTINGTPAFWIPKSNFTVEPKALKAKFEGSYGNLYESANQLVTQKWSEGDLEMEVSDKILGMILYALFGSLSSATFNSVKKHTVTVQNSVQPTTLSLFMNDPIGAGESPTKSIAFGRVMVNSMEINWALGEAVKAKFNFISNGHKDWTRLTPSYASPGNLFAHQNLTFKIAADSSGLDAASKINLQSLQLRMERMAVRENALGTVQPVDILSRAFKVSGKLKLTYEDRTYRDYMLNGTTKAIRIDTVRSDVTIGSTNPAFRFDLPVAHFDQWEPAHPLDDVAMQEINFEALYDVTNNVLLSDAYVVNETTSY